MIVSFLTPGSITISDLEIGLPRTDLEGFTGFGDFRENIGRFSISLHENSGGFIDIFALLFPCNFSLDLTQES